MPKLFICFIAVSLSSVTRCAAQPLISQPDTTRFHAAGVMYGAGPLHRWLFGDLWRDVWTTPLRVPVLDLRRSAGGLTPLKRGGGFQTASLRFRGADGVQYKFRSLDKNPVAVLPEELRETFVASVTQDMIASSHPYAALVAAPLLRAARILQADPTLVLLPDDELLGPYREEFGGLAGFIEIHPDENEFDDSAFAGAEKISGTPALIRRLDRDNEDVVHTASYLKARLMDVFLGDWDRHYDQWRWARFDEGSKREWHPIPRDRDQVFARYDGIAPWLITVIVPQIESCDPEYPGMAYLTWSGRHLDRRFLAEADRTLFDSLATELQSVLTDSVLHAAVNELPEELHGEKAQDLLATLQARRNALPQAADEFYRVLAQEVDIHLSDKDDLVIIDRLGNDAIAVSVFRRMRPEQRLFHRHFGDGCTDEIRIYCNGGDDSVLVRGSTDAHIGIIAIGGPGEDSFTAEAVRIYCRESLLRPQPGPGARIAFIDAGKKSRFNARRNVHIVRNDARADSLEYAFERKYRDWGSMVFPALHGNYNADLGVLIGGGATYTRYGFARVPHAAEVSLVAGIAPMTANVDVRAAADFRLPFDAATVRVDALFTTFEVLNYFGMGNETRLREDRNFTYSVRQNELQIAPSISLQPLPELTLTLRGEARFVAHDLDDEESYLSIERPYGYDRMFFLEGGAVARYDSRDHPMWPRAGAFFQCDATVVPDAYDAKERWTSIGADLRYYLSTPSVSHAALALRLCGRRVDGEAPFFASAFLGGIENARGFEKNRFAGASSLFAAAELRVGVTDVFFLFPSRLGALAFAESGRVWQRGERSSRWHASFGGGAWLAPVSDDFTISANVAASSEGLRFDLISGFAF
ncbi:MAG: outer membrane protein assembly factor [Bacteroidia bacterium]|nr:outer membrane protein assembly factor [Bacteroidia bacterium]